MPTISSFLGITVYMYWRDHNDEYKQCRYLHPVRDESLGRKGTKYKSGIP